MERHGFGCAPLVFKKERACDCFAERVLGA
jgi:hypothetical protein